MNRTARHRLLYIVAFAATLFCATRPMASAAQADSRPNIILFLTDDQDKESIGAYGAEVLTPNLDRMAAEGMLFHNAFVSSTVCTPSRYSFLTGRYAGRSYSRMYLEACPEGQQGYPTFNVELEDDNMNVGNVLRQAGYTTGYVGKFHVGPELKRPDELSAFGLLPVDSKDFDAAGAAFRHNERWYREYLKGKGFSWAKNIYWGNLNTPFNHHNPEWTIDAALEFIEENKDGPFYLHYCTTLVHGPDGSWRNSMDHPLVSGEGMLDQPLDVMTDRQELLDRLEAKGLDPMAGHAGYTWTDDSLGAVLKKLDELGIADNTLVVFIADHGSNMKGSLFRLDGTNVPCIMRWPRGMASGVQSDELIQNIDLAPTFFDLAGATVPSAYQIDGRSLKPLFQGDAPDDWREHLYFEMGAARAVATKDWKYTAIRYAKENIDAIQRSTVVNLPKNMAYIGRSGIGVRGASNPNFFEPDQLYSVRQDPREEKNLAANPEYAEQLAAMRARLTECLKQFDRPFGEFVSGGNAVGPGQVDKQLELVKRLKIQGKNVILPEDLETKPAQQTTSKEQRRLQRKRRRQERQK